jgi:23S rRNA (guanine745-N1)-methyltransferase
MTLDTLSRWLRCPICFRNLDPDGPLTLACGSRHSFDVARRGYVTLLAPRTKVQGDSADMLDARQRFLDEGHYEPLVRALDEMLPRRQDERILDAGCGTGHYLRRMLATRPTASALATDLAPQAVARAVRATLTVGPAGLRTGDPSTGPVDGLVADLWAPLPVRDEAATVIVNVFAPRNPAEYARVLEPGGALVVAVPEPEHLQELRDQGLVLGLQDDKIAKLHATLQDFFVLEHERVVRHSMRLDSTGVDALVGMGPSSHHRDRIGGVPEAPGASGVAMTVTAAVRVLRFRRR